MLNVLVVDDSRDTRDLLERYLTLSGHAVSVASDGQEAWEKIQREPISIVVSDWMMPRMDGVELCRRIREARLSHYVYVILTTARDRPQDLIAGMEAGADDFIVKPINFEILRVRLRAAERILALESQLAVRNAELTHKNGELRLAYEEMRNHLVAAASTQRRLLPPPMPSLLGVELDWLYRPSSYLAGDTFGYFLLDKDHLGIYLLDVAGHGLPAALLSVALARQLIPDGVGNSPVFGALDATGRRAVSPTDAVSRINAGSQFGADSMLFFTMIYGVYHRHERQLELVLAGHPRALHQRGSDVTLVPGEAGFPVGMFPDSGYTSTRLELDPGDRVFLYSDGITECSDPQGDHFGVERLQQLLVERADLPLREVVRAVDVELAAFRNITDPVDDLSLVALRALARS